MIRLFACAAIVMVSGLLPASVHAMKSSTVGSAIGQVYAQGQAPKSGRSTSSPDMTYNGGTVLPTTFSETILWGASWGDSAFAGDKITGIDTFYSGFGGSAYARTSDEYSGSNGQVTDTISYGGHILDPSTAANGSKPSAIMAEVTKEITNPVTNGYYAVYTDVPRGNAKYCAWHSRGVVGGVNVQIAYFYDLDDDAGCDPVDSSGLHSQGMAALANVSAVELSEARTDPRGDAWHDTSGLENGGKCAWTFGSSLVTLSNTSRWKLQGEWSNSAFDGSTGFPNALGQNGCLDGAS